MERRMVNCSSFSKIPYLALELNKSDIDLISTAFKRRENINHKPPCSLDGDLDIEKEERENALSFIANSSHPTLNKGINSENQNFHDSECRKLNQYICIYLKDLKNDVIIQYNHGEYLPLRNAFKKLNGNDKIIIWCVNLLINYHYGAECCEFMSCAIELCLRTLKLMISGSCKSSDDISSHIYEYIDMFQNNKCDQQTIEHAFRIFDADGIRVFRSLLESRHVLVSVQNSRLKVFQNFINGEDSCGRRVVDICFLYDVDSFVSLVEFGATSIPSEASWEEMKVTLRHYCNYIVTCIGLRRPNLKEKHNTTRFRDHSRFDQDSCLFRCLQVSHLHYKMSDGPRGEHLLRLLWSSIPDPYITQNDVSLLSTVGNCSQRNLLEVWWWFDRVVSKGGSIFKSPRSLKHLTRCVVRQSLAVSFQLPKGVESLVLPTSIQNYLLLKE